MKQSRGAAADGNSCREAEIGRNPRSSGRLHRDTKPLMLRRKCCAWRLARSLLLSNRKFHCKGFSVVSVMPDVAASVPVHGGKCMDIGSMTRRSCGRMSTISCGSSLSSPYRTSS